MRHIAIPALAATLTAGAFLLAAITFVGVHDQRARQVRADVESRHLLCLEEKNTRSATLALAKAIRNTLADGAAVAREGAAGVRRTQLLIHYANSIRDVEVAIEGLDRLHCHATAAALVAAIGG